MKNTQIALVFPAALLTLFGLGFFMTDKSSAPEKATISAAQNAVSFDISFSADPNDLEAATNSTQLKRALSLTRELFRNPKAQPQAEDQIREAAAQLNDAEFLALASFAVLADKDADQRLSALYVLTQGGVRAAAALAQVALSPVPETNSKSVDEHAMRISALETLDQLAAEGHDLQGLLAELSSNIQDPTLQWMAGISAMSAQTKKPGQLSRVLDAALKEIED